jgi:hypothetical protein
LYVTILPYVHCYYLSGSAQLQRFHDQSLTNSMQQCHHVAEPEASVNRQWARAPMHILHNECHENSLNNAEIAEQMTILTMRLNDLFTMRLAKTNNAEPVDCQFSTWVRPENGPHQVSNFL